MTSKRNSAFALAVILLFTVVMISTASKGREQTIHFDHPLHVEESGLSCGDCHMGMESLAPGGLAMPDHDVCSMCHDTDDECGICHVNEDEPTPYRPVEGLYEGFGHEAHSKLDCALCHGVTTGEPSIPVMTDCQSCHLDQSGPLECGECHEGKDPVPLDHELTSWHIDHGIEASMRGDECAMCHTQNTCDECHQGENLYGMPHPPTWKFNHGIEAAWSGECLSCHETRSECTECHRTMLPVPHPFGPAYANTSTGGAHVEDAQSFIESCLACHDVTGEEPTCARCHK